MQPASGQSSCSPLITFYVIAFNQEKFIREAVQGALAQTWSPLEIILSDDCSNDQTFGIMQEIADSYRGPHKLILNRNPLNLGVGAHINRILELSSGDFIVASAGDDVSVPQRTDRVYKRWLQSERRAFLVYSNLIEMDEKGKTLRHRDFAEEAPDPLRQSEQWDLWDHICGRVPPYHGATFAYPRALLTGFGPLMEGVIFEDNVLNWRAEGLGCTVLCRQELVYHRNHPTQITNIHSRAALREGLHRRRALQRSDVGTIRQNIAETNILLKIGAIDTDLHAAAIEYLTRRLREENGKFTALYGNYISRVMSAIKLLCSNDKRPIRNPWKFLTYALLPRPLLEMALRLSAFLPRSQ